MKRKINYLEKKVETQNNTTKMSVGGYDLIIIGADCAGLSAGIYSGRKKMNAIILGKKIGGQSLLTGNIENYPGYPEISGPDLILKMKSQVEKFGVPIEEGNEVTAVSKVGDKFVVETKDDKYESISVIVATGRHWRPLNVPGEMEFAGRGVSVCAICDAPFFKDKAVAIVGGGNSAFDSAYDLLKYAKKIFILQHRDKFIGDESMMTELEKSGKVDFIVNAESKEIKGDKFVEALIYTDTKTNEDKTLEVSGVFVNIGQIPNSSFVKDFLKLNDYGEIVINSKTNATSVEGVFAAGDVTDGIYKQSVVAAADGAKSALSAFEYLKSLKMR